MFLFGVCSGLLGAFSQALSYLYTRRFLTAADERRSPVQLLVLSHLWMGLWSLCLLPLLWPMPQAQPWPRLLLPLAGMTLFYMAGQASLFYTVRTLPASRVSPLLGLKILSTGFLVAVPLGQHLSAWQWGGVGLAAVAALALFRAGERIPPQALLGLGLACCFYSASDTCISILIGRLDPERGIRGSALALALCYVSAGLLSLVLPRYWRKASRAAWRGSFPYALAWYLGMVFLFVSIGLVGLVLATILQAMRGPISIGLGRLAARGGQFQSQEQQFDRGVLLRQIAAASLLVLAVALFAWK